jgi:hypothetical protein
VAVSEDGTRRTDSVTHSGFDGSESTTIGLLAVSGGKFPTGTVEHLRSVCRALNAWVVPHQAVVPSASRQLEDGEFVDEGMADRVAILGQRTVEYADIQPDPPSFRRPETSAVRTDYSSASCSIRFSASAISS